MKIGVCAATYKKRACNLPESNNVASVQRTPTVCSHYSKSFPQEFYVCAKRFSTYSWEYKRRYVGIVRIFAQMFTAAS